MALIAAGRLNQVCADGLIVVEPSLAPGGGNLRDYSVRSDSAAAVFALCVEELSSDPELLSSAELAAIRALPDGETVLVSTAGALLAQRGRALVRRLCDRGADVRLGSRVTAVRPVAAGGAQIEVSADDGTSSTITVDRLVLAVGGEPYVPVGVGRCLPGALHSDVLLRPAGLAAALAHLREQPRVLVVGRAHSAFSLADQLLTASASRGWGPGAVTVATPGPVRLTYPDIRAALADGAEFTAEDVCPESGRVWRLCGLRGDAAARYQLARSGLETRLAVEELSGPALTRRAAEADLVVTATGYTTSGMALLPPNSRTQPDGSVVGPDGRPFAGIVTIGLGSAGRRHAETVGEPSYLGPVDGVWYYQTVLAPALLTDLLTDLPTYPLGRPAADPALLIG